ncbi:carbohydrate binding domain-containing protein [Pedobacter panaciterrae]
MKTRFLILFFSLLGNFTFAQGFKKIIGPSPEAAAFTKYTDVPVSNYTGIPNIEIPIHTIKTNDLSSPVSLSYYSGGIRVDEESSRIGLGWTLNAGGLISRSVNGVDDFKPTTGYLNNPIPGYHDAGVTSFFQAQGSTMMVTDGAANPTISLGGNTTNLTGFLPGPGDSEDTWYDMEPDVFNYNFNGYSGKFTIKKNKEVIKENQDAIQIKLLNNDGTSWQITTPNGIRYLFDKVEKARFQSTAGSFSEYITTWYLTKIISLNGVEIVFSYLDNGSYTVKSYNNLNEKYILAVKPLNNIAYTTNYKPNAGTRTTAYPPLKTYNQVMLSAISFPNGSITFEYLSRIDLLGENRLSKILIKDKSGSTISTFDLNQDYFTANSTGTTIVDPEVGLNQDIFNKRLKLVSLVRKNAAGVLDENYRFSYEETNLPSKKSFARDYWGFYNGQHSNNTFLPNTIYKNPFDPSQNLSLSTGANRDPSITYCKAFLLKQITYPTGGTSSFEYESHDYDVANSINNPYQSGEAELLTQTKTFLTRRGQDDTFTFQIPATIENQNIIFTSKSQNGQANVPPLPMADDAFIEVYKASDLITPIKKIFLGLESFWTNSGSYNYKRDDMITLPPGDYVMKTHVTANVLFLNYIDINFKYYYRDNNIPDNHVIRIGGGVRVSKISHFDPSSNQTIFKTYNYHYNFDYNNDGIAEECSYGRKLSNDIFTGYDLHRICGIDPNDPFGNYVVGLSQSYNLYSQSNILSGSAVVGYDKVTVLENGDKLNGYSEFNYKNTPDLEILYTNYLPGFNIRPSGVSNLRSLDNGLLNSQIDYKRIGTNQYSKLKETINSYQNLPVMSHVGLRITNTNASGCTVVNSEGYLLSQYPVSQSAWSSLSSQITNDYSDPSIINSVKTEYQYENIPRHYQPIVTVLNNSKGKQTSTVTLYPSDYASGNTAIDEMKSINLVQPIEQVSFLKDGSTTTIVSGKISQYKTGSKGLLDKEYFLERTAPVALASFKFSNQVLGTFPSLNSGNIFGMDTKYKLRVSYNKYDLLGNILEQEITTGQKYSYKWGYKEQYPIAEVKNSTVNELYSQNFEEPELGLDFEANVVYDNTRAHTGKYSGRIINPNATEFVSHSSKRLDVILTAPKKFTFSGWVYSNGPSVQLFLFMMKAGETGYNTYYDHMQTTVTNKWVYMKKEFTVPADVVQMFLRLDNNAAGTVWFDDLRIQPSDAAMSTYTYDPMVGMTSMIDDSGKTVYYEYDTFQRLMNIRDQNWDIIKHYDYHYKP